MESLLTCDMLSNGLALLLLHIGKSQPRQRITLIISLWEVLLSYGKNPSFPWQLEIPDLCWKKNSSKFHLETCVIWPNVSKMDSNDRWSITLVKITMAWGQKEEITKGEWERVGLQGKNKIWETNNPVYEQINQQDVTLTEGNMDKGCQEPWGWIPVLVVHLWRVKFKPWAMHKAHVMGLACHKTQLIRSKSCNCGAELTKGHRGKGHIREFADNVWDGGQIHTDWYCSIRSEFSHYVSST